MPDPVNNLLPAFTEPFASGRSGNALLDAPATPAFRDQLDRATRSFADDRRQRVEKEPREPESRQGPDRAGRSATAEGRAERREDDDEPPAAAEGPQDSGAAGAPIVDPRTAPILPAVETPAALPAASPTSAPSTVPGGQARVPGQGEVRQPAPAQEPPLEPTTGDAKPDSARVANATPALGRATAVELPDSEPTPCSAAPARRQEGARSTEANPARSQAKPEGVEELVAEAVASATRLAPAGHPLAREAPSVRGGQQTATAAQPDDIDPAEPFDDDGEPVEPDSEFDRPPEDGPARALRQRSDVLAQMMRSTGATAVSTAPAPAPAATAGPSTGGAGQSQPAVAEAPAARPPAAPGAASPLPSAPVAVQTILAQVRMQVRPGIRELQIRLEPPELGSLKLRFVLKGEGLSVSVRASRQDVVTALRNDLSSFSNTLRDAGIDLDSLDIDLDSGPDARHAEGESFAEHLDAAAQVEPDAADPAAAMERTDRATHHDGAVDIIA